eukprot:206033-Pelagomonas_calceolata.AAC.1
MAKSSEHAAGPFMASTFRVRQLVCEKYLANRPYVSLWLSKMYVVPAGTYAGQVWCTGAHWVVKRITTNWAVLRECGHEPLQFY